MSILCHEKRKEQLQTDITFESPEYSRLLYMYQRKTGLFHHTIKDSHPCFVVLLFPPPREFHSKSFD